MIETLVGRIGLLTGASAGLGPYIARRLHREGVRLVLSARSRDALRALSRELHGSSIAVADLTDRAQVAALAEAAGPVDILVANAGQSASGALSSLAPEVIDEVLEVNLRAPIMLSRLVLPGMLARGSGHIVLMASMAGQVSLPHQSIYNATKFGLRGFGHSVRAELRGTGVTLSIVSPYFVTGPDRPAGTLPGQVSPERVAEAVFTAITRGKAEITVAPRALKAGVRIPMAFPALARFSPREDVTEE